MTGITSVIKERRSELEAAIASGERAAALEAEIESMRRDLKRIEGSRDKLTALGAEYVTIEQRAYHQGFGLEVEYEPIRSTLNGKELAARQEERAAHLRDEIAKREREIEQLLGG